MNGRWAVVLAAALSCAPSRACFGAGMEILASFAGGDAKLEMVTFTKATETIGMLGIKAAKKISFGVRKPLWLKVLALAEEAGKVESKKWTFVGSLTESDTTNPSHLVVYAGPAVQFVITDPSIGTFAVTLRNDERAAVAAAIKQVADKLTEVPPK